MKRIIALTLAILIILSLSACSKKEDSGLADKFYNKKDPIQIVDGAGRKVSFSKPAMTMATSWGGVIDSYMFSLEITDRIVGTRSGNNMHKLCMPNLSEIPAVGRYDLDKEALAAVAPDVFLHCAAATDILTEANNVGFRAIGVDTNTLAGIHDAINLLGTVFGVEDRAKYVVSYYDNILKIVDEHTAKLSKEDKIEVVVLAHSAGEIASSENSVLDEMIERAGGISCAKKNLADENGIYSTSETQVGQEVIMQWNPKVIFTQECVGEFTAETVLAMNEWSAMDAVVNGKVYSIPCVSDAWYTSTPSACLGVLFVSMKLYPELYADIEFEQIVTDFYRDIYGLDMTREDLGF